MTRRTFTAHFSGMIRSRERYKSLQAESAALDAGLSEAKRTIERLRLEKSELVRKMASEAFKLKAQGPCYSKCPVMKSKEWTEA